MRRCPVRESIPRNRRWSWWLLGLAAVFAGSTGSCIGNIQRELEVLFAPEATENALLIPQSFVYNVFGDFLFKIFHYL
jgi:hypothetical protein